MQPAHLFVSTNEEVRHDNTIRPARLALTGETSPSRLPLRQGVAQCQRARDVYRPNDGVERGQSIRRQADS